MFTESTLRMVRYASQTDGRRRGRRDIVSESDGAGLETLRPIGRGRPRRLDLYSSPQHLPQPDEASASGTGQCESTLRSNAGRCKSNYREHEALLQKAETIARSLPEPTCTILRLCYYEHLTYREVAQQLGISPDTVKKHISKALRTLREAMKE